MLMLPPDATHAEMENPCGNSSAFNDPLPIQYWRFASHAVQGDLGISLQHECRPSTLILERLPAALGLAGAPC